MNDDEQKDETEEPTLALVLEKLNEIIGRLDYVAQRVEEIPTGDPY